MVLLNEATWGFVSGDIEEWFILLHALLYVVFPWELKQRGWQLAAFT